MHHHFFYEYILPIDQNRRPIILPIRGNITVFPPSFRKGKKVWGVKPLFKGGLWVNTLVEGKTLCFLQLSGPKKTRAILLDTLKLGVVEETSENAPNLSVSC